MRAEIEVLTVINTNTTKDVEAHNHLIDGIEPALKKTFDVTAITVLGKSYSTHIKTFWIQWSVFCLTSVLRTDGASNGQLLQSWMTFSLT